MYGNGETVVARAPSRWSSGDADQDRGFTSAELLAAASWCQSLNNSCGRNYALQGIAVLLVDDAQDIRLLVSTLLRGAGAEVHAVADATEALSALKMARPTIIISDISMPDIDGYELMRTIRALPPTAGGDIPAIALTAYVSEKDRQLAFAAGFQAHLGKPVGTANLIDLVVELTGNASTVH